MDMKPIDFTAIGLSWLYHPTYEVQRALSRAALRVRQGRQGRFVVQDLKPLMGAETNHRTWGSCLLQHAFFLSKLGPRIVQRIGLFKWI